LKDEFDAEILYDDPLIAVSDAQHPLTRRRMIEFSELVSEAWAMPPANTPTGKYVRDAFQKNGLALPTTIVSTYSTFLRHNLVATARYITVLPKSMFELMAKRHSLKALPVHLPARRRTVAIVFLKNRTLSPVAHLFIEAIRGVANPHMKKRKIAQLAGEGRGGGHRR